LNEKFDENVVGQENDVKVTTSNSDNEHEISSASEEN